MNFNSYEEMLESQQTDPGSYACEQCEGANFHGVSGWWEWKDGVEIFRRCHVCGGIGSLTPREVGEV